jgi:hypothetical protein
METMKRPLAIAWLILMLLGVTAGVEADEWVGPIVREVFSASRDWFVRVVPGKNEGDSTRVAGAAKASNATAEFYRRQEDRSYRLVSERALANPVAAVDFLVTDRGYLATVDNWGSIGYGKVVVLYSPRGDLIQAFELKDLFSADEIEKFAHSVSSIWWRSLETQIAHIREGQQALSLTLESNGRVLTVETETGAWQYCEWRTGKHLCRTTNGSRKWTEYIEPTLKP